MKFRPAMWIGSGGEAVLPGRCRMILRGPAPRCPVINAFTARAGIFGLVERPPLAASTPPPDPRT